MPSVILVGNYIYDKQQSMQRYAEILHAELLARGHTVVLIRPTPRLGRLCPGAAGLGKWLGYIDKYMLFPFELSRLVRTKPDFIVHICDHSNAMYALFIRHTPKVVTCHDLLGVRSALGHFPENPVGWTGRMQNRCVLWGMRHANRIVCVSMETRRQLLALGGFDRETIEVVHNGLNYAYEPLSNHVSRELFISRPQLRPFVDRKYVFFIGGCQWYKNRLGLLRIFLNYAQSNLDGAILIFAGMPFTKAEKKIIANYPAILKNRIYNVGGVDNEGLNALYARAACLLFPSLEEGFGWPILEAMSAGCRVLTTDKAPMNEVGGKAASYINANDEAGAALILEDIVNESAEIHAFHVDNGYHQAELFSTNKMIEEILVIYTLMCGEQI